MRLGKPCSPEPTLWNIWVYCGGGDPKDRPHESSHDLTETNGEPWITETFCKWFATLPRLHVWKSWDDASDSIEMLTAKQPQLFFKWNVPIARGRLPISHLFSFDRLAIFSHHITAASTYFRLCRDANCIIFQKKACWSNGALLLFISSFIAMIVDPVLHSPHIVFLIFMNKV